MLGSLNPLPFQVGGGPTRSSKAYQTLRQAVGQGGSAKSDLGIDGLWRRAEAKGMAAATSSTRRALFQAFPQCATDLIPYYERRLGLTPGATDNEEQRRRAVVVRWVQKPIRSWPELEQALKAIDPRFALVLPSDSIEIVGWMGRAFDAYIPSDATNGPPMGLPGGCSLLPGYSTRDLLRVSFPPGYVGVPTPADLERIERAKRLLRSTLAPWVNFQISIGPWKLSETPIGYGELA
jgi:hypothetical protein